MANQKSKNENALETIELIYQLDDVQNRLYELSKEWQNDKGKSEN